MLTVTTFDDVRAARGYKLRRSDGSLHELPSGAGALLAWARREKLLPGRRSRILDKSLADRRNDAAHPVRHTVRMPPGAAQTIRIAAEYINQLWGQATPNGRLFPAPIKRIARVAAVAPDGSAASQLRLDQLRQVDAAARGWLYQVVLASAEEELISVRSGGLRFAHVPGFQTTAVSCEELWRGGYDELVALVDAGDLVTRGDGVDSLDRLFFIRKAGETLDDARSPADLLALAAPPPGHWHAITADSPLDAWCHVRDHSDRETEAGDECPECFVRVDGEFTDPADVIEVARERCASSMT